MKTLVVFSLGCILAGILSFLGLGGYFIYDLYYQDDPRFKKEAILDILSKETLVYYNDEKTQLGSLFGKEHRHYVSLNLMPPFLLDAVVAAEDEDFYAHFGVDVHGLLRAIYKNVVLRKREGASTITQQTVKNLFGRKKTNIYTKLIEMIHALKMEKNFSKQDILEFYLNQFHVVGNGRGIGIASKYYFDKEPMQLTLVEAAFIAGSVKGPEKYNPFTKRNQDAQNRAKTLARQRKDYVLKRMFQAKIITKEQYELSLKEEIPFNLGRFRFDDIPAIELIQRQVLKKEVLTALDAEDLSDIEAQGLKIITTLHPYVHAKAQYKFRQNLGRLETILSGYIPEKTVQYIDKLEPYKFYFGKIQSKDSKTQSLEISFGVPTCKVNEASIFRVAEWLDINRGRISVEKTQKILWSQLKEGDGVLVSVQAQEGDKWICDLERKPKIRGALVILKEGEVIAFGSGFYPNEYNRAFFARRQMGSTFKTFTYAAAMQMGWVPQSLLPNVRKVYLWQNQFYYPRPDHTPRTLEVDFMEAGSRSENLATVHLLSELMRNLDINQFAEVIQRLGFNLENRDEMIRLFNVRFIDVNYQEGFFNHIRNKYIAQTQHPYVRSILYSMGFGYGFDKESMRVKKRKDLSLNERTIRLQLLKNNYLRWRYLMQKALASFQGVQAILNGGGGVVNQTFPFFGLSPDGQSLVYLSDSPLNAQALSGLLNPQKWIPLKDPKALISALSSNPKLLDVNQILLDGIVPLGMIQAMDEELHNMMEKIPQLNDMEKFYWNADFKYSLGMYYVSQMLKHMGFIQPIPAVPSLPLGSSDVTLVEMALGYQSFLEGTTTKFFEEGAENQVLMVKKITDYQGTVLWEPKPVQHALFPAFLSAMIFPILRAAVTHGTGRQAQGIHLQPLNLTYPTLGKTGTTNEYTNASYVGYVPIPSPAEASQTGELKPQNSFTVASYVGYDDNVPMKRKGFRIGGGTGALPGWIGAAQTLLEGYEFAKSFPLDIKEIKVEGQIFDGESQGASSIDEYDGFSSLPKQNTTFNPQFGLIQP